MREVPFVRKGRRSRACDESSRADDALHHAQAPAVFDHSRTLPQGNGVAGPADAGCAVGRECNLVPYEPGVRRQSDVEFVGPEELCLAGE